MPGRLNAHDGAEARPEKAPACSRPGGRPPARSGQAAPCRRFAEKNTLRFMVLLYSDRASRSYKHRISTTLLSNDESAELFFCDIKREFDKRVAVLLGRNEFTDRIVITDQIKHVMQLEE